MKSWKDLSHYAGFDWAREHHDVVVVDRAGKVAADFRLEDTATGWADFTERMKRFPAVGVVVETCQGAAVERLLQMEVTVYPVNPKCAERYRERKTPTGLKTDRLDAWSLADALRLDGSAWRSLKAEDPGIQELRLLCRDEVGLIEERTAHVNQLQQALHEYYPVALEAFDDWTRPSSWEFVIQFPTPQALAKAGTKKWNSFLHTHRLARTEKDEERMNCFARAQEFCGSEPTTRAKSLLAVSLAKMLLTLEHRLDAYRARINELFEQHPDHDLFGSLPGAGEKTLPRLLAELGDDRARFDSAEALQCYAGTAPVTYQSGKMKKARMRRACNKHLRFAVHWLADLSRGSCEWARVFYGAPLHPWPAKPGPVGLGYILTPPSGATRGTVGSPDNSAPRGIEGSPSDGASRGRENYLDGTERSSAVHGRTMLRHVTPASPAWNSVTSTGRTWSPSTSRRRAVRGAAVLTIARPPIASTVDPYGSSVSTTWYPSNVPAGKAPLRARMRRSSSGVAPVLRWSSPATRTVRTSTPTSASSPARHLAPSSFVRPESPTNAVFPATRTSPPSRWPRSMSTTRSRVARKARTDGTSGSRAGAPGRVITARSPTTTAVSSTKQASGRSASGASHATAHPAHASAAQYSVCCACARPTSIGREGSSRMHRAYAREGGLTSAVGRWSPASRLAIHGALTGASPELTGRSSRRAPRRR